MAIDISIIMPVYNGELWLQMALDSVLEQTFQGTVELSIFNDGSTDGTAAVIENNRESFHTKGILLTVHGHSKEPRGVGFAKNQAIAASCGTYLCFLDADDVMLCNRLQRQWELCQQHPTDIIGCQFRRDPPASTERYTKWANSLSEEQLNVQIFTSHGPTVIMPSWFCHRNAYNAVPGGFSEAGKGTPEDLIFFFHHLRLGGGVRRVNEELLVYRFHSHCATFSVSDTTIWNIRMEALQKQVLSAWNEFSVWNAGKQGRRFYRSLDEENKKKVVCFGDVDVKKIALKVYTYEESKELIKPRIPIVHFSQMRPPIVICMKQVPMIRLNNMACFACCMPAAQVHQRRPPIDRSLIGLPTNFQHIQHVGSDRSSISSTPLDSPFPTSLNSIHMKLIDLPPNAELLDLRRREAMRSVSATQLNVSVQG